MIQENKIGNGTVFSQSCVFGCYDVISTFWVCNQACPSSLWNRPKNRSSYYYKVEEFFYKIDEFFYKYDYTEITSNRDPWIVHKTNSRQLIICALRVIHDWHDHFFQGKWQGSSFLKGKPKWMRYCLTIILVLFILIGIFSGVQ